MTEACVVVAFVEKNPLSFPLTIQVKVRDAIKLIEKNGWRLKRTRGDHRVYTHPAKPGIVVIPGHQGSDLAAGTYSSILKQAGLK